MVAAMFADGSGANTIDSVQQKKLALEQLRLALKNLKPNCWMMPLLAVIICVMFADWVSVPVLAFWFALVAIGGSYLGIVAFAFPRADSRSLASHNWQTHAAIGYALFAASWSSLVILFWRHGDNLNQMLILLLIACTLAGNAAL